MSSSNYTDDFINSIVRVAVGSLCQTIGWNSVNTNALDILSDLMRRQFMHIAKSSHRYAEHYGRGEVNLNDVALSLQDNGVIVSELLEYVQNFDPVTLPYKVPNFPISTESHLNFLRPGSDEVLTRPVHIHEYLPPMILSEESYKEENVNDEDESRVINGESENNEMVDQSVSASNSILTSIEVDTTEVKVKKEISPPLPLPAEPKLTQEVDLISDITVEIGDEVKKEKVSEVTNEDKVNKSDIVEVKSEKENGIKGAEPQQIVPKTTKAQELPVEIDDDDDLIPDSTPSISFTPFSKSKRLDGHENEALKRMRLLLEEEGHPLREIKSVMMTSSGFLSSSCEGKLPDIKPPKHRDFFDPAPIESLEQKKKKIPSMKKFLEGSKKIDKDQDKDKDVDGFSLFENPDKILTKISKEKSPLISSNSVKLKKKKEKFDFVDEEEGSDDVDEDDEEYEEGEIRPEKPKKPTAKEGLTKLEIFKKKKLSNKKDLIKSISKLEKRKKDKIKLNVMKGLKIKKIDKKGGGDKSLKLKLMKPSSGKQNKEIKHPFNSPLPKLASAESSPSSGSLSSQLLKKKRGRPKKYPDGTPPLFSSPARIKKEPPLKKFKKDIQAHNMKADIRSINLNKHHPPPDLDLLSRLPSQPGLIPSLPALPPLKFGGSLSSTLSITPSKQTKSKQQQQQSKANLPSSFCSSVTITRIDMSNSQKLPNVNDSQSTPGIGTPPPLTPSPSLTNKSNKSSSSVSNNSPASTPPIQADSSSGITITPIVLEDTNDHQKHGGSVSESSKTQQTNIVQAGLAKIEEIKAKEQKRKDKEKRKELKKEKKKEKKEKERREKKKSLEIVGDDGKTIIIKKEKKEKSEKKKKKSSSSNPIPIPEGPIVPKLTLKLGHSNTPTPKDSPNPYLHDEVTPAAPKKIIIKPQPPPAEEKDSSLEFARFVPLVTRTPKASLPKKSPPAPVTPLVGFQNLAQEMIVQAASRSSGGKKAQKPKPKAKEGGTRGKPPKSVTATAGLVTETVGFYIDDQGNKIWICPTCGRQDDGSPMIGCDICDDWYHFTCVGISDTDTPDENESWYCKKCIGKKKASKR